MRVSVSPTFRPFSTWWASTEAGNDWARVISCFFFIDSLKTGTLCPRTSPSLPSLPASPDKSGSSSTSAKTPSGKWYRWERSRPTLRIERSYYLPAERLFRALPDYLAFWGESEPPMGPVGQFTREALLEPCQAIPDLRDTLHSSNQPGFPGGDQQVLPNSQRHKC